MSAATIKALTAKKIRLACDTENKALLKNRTVNAAETKKPAPISIAWLSTQFRLWLIRRHTPYPSSVRQIKAKKLVAMSHAALNAQGEYICITRKDERKTFPFRCGLRVLSEG